MIDGVKIKCVGTKTSDWTSNPILKFTTKVDISTGEIATGYLLAWHRGLCFKIIPSTIPGQPENLFVLGSLATYYNYGLNNAFDFDTGMLAAVIKELQTGFAINPSTAVIQVLEFGANLNTHQTPKQIINGLRAWQSDTFTGLKMDNVFNGKQLKKQNTIFKIYDKGLQTGNKQTNLLRMEFVFRYNKQAQKHGVNVLADLLNLGTLNAIKPLVCEVWANAIYFDNSHKRQTLQRMADRDKKKFLLYLDGTAWVDFTKEQRRKARAKFKTLCSEFCTSTTHADILNLLTEKLDTLTMSKTAYMPAVESHKKEHHLQSFRDDIPADNQTPKRTPFTTLDKLVKGVQNTSPKTPKTPTQKCKGKEVKKAQPKTPKTPKAQNRKTSPQTPKKNCIVCRAEIGQKKRAVLYCSKHCNNSARANREKLHRQQTANQETILLNGLALSTLTDSSLEVTHRKAGQPETWELKPKEMPTAPAWVRQVTQVKIEVSNPHAPPPGNTLVMVFTSFRAKKLIRLINQQNKPTNEKDKPPINQT